MLCLLYNFLYIRPTNRAFARFVQDVGMQVYCEEDLERRGKKTRTRFEKLRRNA